jgi:hypothetical protein
MKPNKPFFFFLIFMMGIVPFSCDVFCSDDCSCGRLPKIQNFIIDEFIIDFIANNRTAFPEETYSVEDLIIRISPQYVTYPVVSFSAPISFNGYAFACDPIPPGSVHYVKDIKVINNQSFSWHGQEFITGEEVTELFRLAGFQLDPSFEFLYQYRFNFLGQEPLLIRVKDQPLEKTRFDVTIRLTLSDDREFAFEDLRFSVE